MRTILVADDDRHIREGFERELTLEGHRTLLARDADEARTLLGTRDVDLFVTDIDMAGDVRGLLMWMSDRLPLVPVIVFSGATRWIPEGLSRFAFAVVDKGAPWEDLLRAVDRALARRAAHADLPAAPGI